MMPFKDRLLKKEVERYLHEHIKEWKPLKNGGSTNASFYGVTDSNLSFTAKYNFLCRMTLQQRKSRKYIDQETGYLFPKFIGSFLSFFCPFHVCFITEWVPGHGIDLQTLNGDLPRLFRCAQNAAEQIKKLHSVEVPNGSSVQSVKRDYTRALRAIRLYRIDVPHLSAFRNYVENRIGDLKDGKKGYVHFDFHIGNLLEHNNDYRVIDFETVCAADPWRDLVYAMEINFPEQHLFWFAFLLHYFDGEIPNEFFLRVKSYVIIYMLMLAKYNKDTNPKMYCNLVNKVYEDYNQLDSIVPNWFIQTAMNLCDDPDRVIEAVQGVELNGKNFVFDKSVLIRGSWVTCQFQERIRNI